MIARHWRGWTEVHNANAYESLLKTKVLPELKQLSGYRGGYILRSDAAACLTLPGNAQVSDCEAST
jgi:hypothetical protein